MQTNDSFLQRGDVVTTSQRREESLWKEHRQSVACLLLFPDNILGPPNLPQQIILFFSFFSGLFIDVNDGAALRHCCLRGPLERGGDVRVIDGGDV